MHLKGPLKKKKSKSFQKEERIAAFFFILKMAAIIKTACRWQSEPWQATQLKSH